MTSLDTQLPDTSVCPGCGAGLRCGMVAGDAQCWCVQLPNIMPLPTERAPLLSTDADAASASAASCFCPACLKKITDDRLHAPA